LSHATPIVFVVDGDVSVPESLERSPTALDREAEIRALRDSYASLKRRERQVMALVVSGQLN
jgi:FixJ family two-component response regulator